MIGLPDLNSSLLELLHELQGTEVKLIIGGGFGTVMVKFQLVTPA